LLDTKDADRFALAQILLDSVDDGMTESERAELDAAIEESYADMESGRMRSTDEVIAELRATL
jgi:predicted transcriptional regulator